MNNETVLDDYLEQLLGEATTTLAEPVAIPAAGTAAEPPAEREPTWDDLPDEVVYETGPASSEDPALMDEASLQAAFDAAADAPLPAAGPEPEPTWDDLPDEVIYETGEDVSAVLTNADSPSLEAAFAAAADPIAALLAPAPPAAPAAPALPPRTVARATPALAQPNENPPSTWQELQEQARQSGYASSPQRRATERSSRWLRLRCGSQAYALELLKVQEVVLPVPLLPLRGTAPAMLGIMNLRGQVVPVMDLGIHLGGAPAGEDALTRIVVLEENGEIMGLRVSAVEDVTNLSDSQIEPPDTARICRISNDIFRGVARLHQQPMILLDATQLLN
ncbi:chemotaxis protein CheW [Stenotrophomonas sp. CFBP 13724]|uniref:chemotaxis protein CheW n=1 Tax=Stenotrophomonas sp. CFBP 13724 TaxID=2775298 RepID=UPI001781BBEC|nr:chemotaxis protein CheW [Stenotrophomonas sp. CFBP 13724]MBD8642992.1 chemotaxis protein CheW [Stenotrophomonas sp. CFBP 13724]